MPTCFPHQTCYSCCWSTAVLRWVDCPPVIHIGHITAAVESTAAQEDLVAHLLPTSDMLQLLLISCCTWIGYITATVDQLLHSEEEVAHLLSSSDRLLSLLISCCTQKSRLPTCYPHRTYTLFIMKLLEKDRYYTYLIICIHTYIYIYMYMSTIPTTLHIANYCTTWNTLWIFHVYVCSSNNKKQYFVLQTEFAKLIYFLL